MERWEQRTVFDRDRAKFDEKLMALGRDGWKVVGFSIGDSATLVHYGWHAVVQRPLPPDDPN